MTSLEPLITFRILFNIFSDSGQEYDFLGPGADEADPFPSFRTQIFDEVSVLTTSLPHYLTTSLPVHRSHLVSPVVTIHDMCTLYNGFG